jgi:chemotaxis protein MotB
MAAEAVVRPIIVIKKKVSHGGHHGGAWKVAYADFVTAMMSLFIVLWLLNSTPQIKKAVAGYFNDPKSAGKETGSAALGAGETVSIDQKNVEKLKEEIEKAILQQKDLDKLEKQIEVTITTEGLKIELIEDNRGTFFESGSAKLSETGTKLLGMLAGQVSSLPNRLLIEGHTDSQPFASENGYSNWELSSDRANSARRVLQQGGVGASQIAQVRGYADQYLRVPENPMDPSNRRISLIVQWVDAPAAAAGAEEAGKDGKNEAGKPAEAGGTKEVKGKADGAKPNAETAKPDAGGKADAAAAVAKDVAPAAPAVAAKPAAGTVLAKPSMLDRVKAMIPGKKK